MKSEERQSDKSGERLGTIYADAVYAYENFQHLIGQGRAGMRSLRMKGLRVIRAGNRRYVIGGDWLMFLQQIASNVQSDPNDRDASDSKLRSGRTKSRMDQEFAFDAVGTYTSLSGATEIEIGDDSDSV